jgi:hypothetical protein
MVLSSAPLIDFLTVPFMWASRESNWLNYTWHALRLSSFPARKNRYRY